MLVTVIVFLLILSVLVLIHEAGHFFTAKKLGMKVEEFGFGLPLLPAIFQIKRGETVYSIYPALIGGFVKLYGEDEAGAGRIKASGKGDSKASKEDEKRAFYNRPIWQRSAVVIAGVVMNTLLAVVIFYVFMFLSNFKTELPVYPPGITVPKFYLVNEEIDSQIIISDIAKNSPAEKAGMEPISQVLSINGQYVYSMDDFLDVVNENKGEEILVKWKNLNDDSLGSATIIPRVNPPEGEGALGVGFFESQTIHLDYSSPVDKALSGISHPINLMVYNFVALKHLIDLSFQTGNVDALSQGVAGPVGIFNVVGAVVEIPDVKMRVMQLLNLAGILSISLAFFNVLPIPGLDGGRLFFILAEGIFGIKIGPKVEGYINAAGMAFLLTLILLVTYKDVMQLIFK